jgi:antitoxin component of RelBE/YafQ-DinJ toxin-antitoxin module
MALPEGTSLRKVKIVARAGEIPFELQLPQKAENREPQ